MTTSHDPQIPLVVNLPPAPEFKAPATEAAPSLAVRCVRALLERHSLPRYRHSAWLAEALGLSYSQAHRRLTGASSWSLEDLERVGAVLGESLSQVLSLRSDDDGAASGTFRIGSTALPCRVWVGEPSSHAAPDELVAVRTGGAEWAILRAAEADLGAAYRVDRVEIRPREAKRRTIAVLDDDHDLANTICAHLDAVGYDAQPFFRTADLVVELQGGQDGQLRRVISRALYNTRG